MKTIEIYDPAMCCPTGLCGPSIDPELSRVAADLDQLKKAGVEVTRYNLSQDAGAFADRAEIKKLLEQEGPEVLPVTIVEGEVYKTQGYPTHDELEELFGELPGQTEEKENLLTENIRELIAIGASIAANCEPCFRAHYKKAKDLGISKKEMLEAVNVGDGVKKASAQNILNLADRYLAGKKTLNILNDQGNNACFEPGSSDSESSSCC